MSTLLFSSPAEVVLPPEVPHTVAEIPFTGDDLHTWYNWLRSSCEVVPTVDYVDVHFFDSLRVIAWFMRYRKDTQVLELHESTPFHAGWISRQKTESGSTSFAFDLDSYRANAYRFIPRRRILWNVLSEKIHGGIRYKGTPKHLIKRVAFSVYNDVDD